MDNTVFVLNLLRTHSMYKSVINFFWDVQMALAEGEIEETDIEKRFMEQFASIEYRGFGGKTIPQELIDWEHIFQELKEENSPTYLSKFMVRGKLEDRGIDPENTDFFGWDIVIGPNEENEYNKSLGIWWLEKVRQYYYEAAAIGKKSPRGAAALLRLAIQVLIQEILNDPKIGINRGISKLVDYG